MTYFADALRQNPELAIFLTLALGFLIGRVKFGTFKLGNVVGTLLAGVVVGQLGIQVNPVVKLVFFDLFLFATGYKVGPQFFRGLKKNALAQVSLTLVLCVTSLLTTVAAAKVFRYDCGTAAGLMAGAFTESTVIGTAGETINRLPLPEAERKRLLDQIPVAYAVSYLVGTGFVVWFLANLAPRLLRVNLKEESKKLEATLSGGPVHEPGVQSAYRDWDTRAYLLPVFEAGRRVSDFESSFAPDRVFVPRLRRVGVLVEASPETVLAAGDHVAIVARRRVHHDRSAAFGEEEHDRDLLDFPITTVDAVVTNREAAERTLQDLAEEHGRGVALLKHVRGGEEMPIAPGSVVNRGDLLQIAGTPTDVARAGKALGYVERPSSETDVVFLGLGILLGGFVGLLSVTVGGLPLSLTASGGALIMGLVFGWLRSVRPLFGRIPEAALWIFDTVGLAVFIGVVGLSAGPSFVSGLKETGPSLLVVGLVVAVTPHIAALLFGRYVLKMNPVILFGACTGAGTVTAALRAVQDEAGSKLPVLGYTVPYAIGNILLTAWGPVIVMLTK
ncbi:MAG TPA: aspartate-alanine antiporter [Thermoanaerobaculia bacterium]|nr:aspartate-alanine antiporter [Thermoanaerobaculia bacterium]HQR66370.1 aspartate-alanine antiporter [Thermoanaerobaculia bacterium]